MTKKNVDEAGQRARLQLFQDQQRALLAERRAEYEAMGTVRVPEPVSVPAATGPALVRSVVPTSRARDWRTIPKPAVTLAPATKRDRAGALFLPGIWLWAAVVLWILCGGLN